MPPLDFKAPPPKIAFFQPPVFSSRKGNGVIKAKQNKGFSFSNYEVEKGV